MAVLVLSWALFGLQIGTGFLQADVRLPAFFSDHMVLQRIDP